MVNIKGGKREMPPRDVGEDAVMFLDIRSPGELWWVNFISEKMF